MIKKLAITAAAALCFAAAATAQSGALPLLNLEQDVRAAGMAGVLTPKSNTGSIFSSPTDLLFTNGQHLRAIATFGANPSEGITNTGVASASLGYKIGNHAILFGARYRGSEETGYYSDDGTLRATIHPRDWSLDFGYAVRLGEGFGAFARATYLQSYNSLTADVFTLSLGASYRGQVSLGSYLLTASLDNFGGKYQYGSSGPKYDLPTTATLSGAISLLDREQLTLGARANYFLTPSGDKTIACGLGAQWEAVSDVFVRTGYTIHRNANIWSMGAGARLGIVDLDLSYDIHKIKEFNSLRLGVSVGF